MLGNQVDYEDEIKGWYEYCGRGTKLESCSDASETCISPFNVFVYLSKSICLSNKAPKYSSPSRLKMTKPYDAVWYHPLHLQLGSWCFSLKFVHSPQPPAGTLVIPSQVSTCSAFSDAKMAFLWMDCLCRPHSIRDLSSNVRGRDANLRNRPRARHHRQCES